MKSIACLNDQAGSSSLKQEQPEIPIRPTRLDGAAKEGQEE